MSRESDDFSIEKPDIERNLRALLFEREAEIERLNRYTERLRANAERDANEIERLTAENKWLYDQIAAQKRTAGASAVAALCPSCDCGDFGPMKVDLRAENERLKAQNDMIFTDAAALTQAVDAMAVASRELRTEIERLKAERINLLNWLNTHHSHVAIAWARARARAQSQNYCILCGAALEPKP